MTIRRLTSAAACIGTLTLLFVVEGCGTQTNQPTEVQPSANNLTPGAEAKSDPARPALDAKPDSARVERAQNEQMQKAIEAPPPSPSAAPTGTNALRKDIALLVREKQAAGGQNGAKQADMQKKIGELHKQTQNKKPAGDTTSTLPPNSVEYGENRLEQAQQADEEDDAAKARPQLPPAVNPWVEASKDHLSTFGMDVDTASYTVARSYLKEYGQLPPAELVRVEEFVNYFDYAYQPAAGKTFNVVMEGCPNPFHAGSSLLRVGVRAKNVEVEERKSANLVFVVDVSGSMGRANRLPLVKESLHVLLDHLQEGDSVAIVIFSNTCSTLIPLTAVTEKQKVSDAIDQLSIGGATAMEGGMRLGYQVATDGFNADKINRVIVCTDGEANVGATGPDEILKEIATQKDKGVYLSTIGFGLGNYNDTMLEKLADQGNGNYSHIDSLTEAKRVFVEKLTGMLMAVAKDAKIQVDFNPDRVEQYRLIGYEDRDIADQDFRNDKVDAGEVGAGHSVTALYEVKLKGVPGDSPKTDAIAKVRIRYKDAATKVGAEDVHEEAYTFESGSLAESLDKTSLDTRLAVAVGEFAEVLRRNPDAPANALDQIKALAEQVAQARNYDDKLKELASLIAAAQKLTPAPAPVAVPGETPVSVK